MSNSDGVDQELMSVIYDVYRIMRERFSFNENFTNLTILQFHTLSYINKEKRDINVKEISNFLRISMPTATVLVKRLVELGLLKKSKSKKDKRILNLTLTDEGKRMVEKIIFEKKRRFNVLLSSLTAKDKQTLIKIFRKVIPSKTL